MATLPYRLAVANTIAEVPEPVRGLKEWNDRDLGSREYPFLLVDALGGRSPKAVERLEAGFEDAMKNRARR